MKIAIIAGSLVTVFLILMMPNVRTVEFIQVTSGIEEKISGLVESISQRLEQANDKQLSALSKWIDIANLKVFLNEITNNGNGICLSCENINSDCVYLLIICLLIIFLAITASPSIIGLFILWGLVVQFKYRADTMGCFWAKIVDFVWSIIFS
jgi:ABC-type protease/lipase transport system fused ATPase/permease subunit